MIEDNTNNNINNNTSIPKVKAATLFETNVNDYNENDKVVCVNCTNSFFEVYFTEQAKDKGDEIVQDILTKKVYMNLNKQHGCYICPSCGKVELIKDTLVNEPVKKLTAVGLNSYSEYNKLTGSTGTFSKGTMPKHKNREDLLF